MPAKAEAIPASPKRSYVDTSALAKWYLNEEASDRVEAYLQSLPCAGISSLTVVEMRCLLARRRRSAEITPEQELQCYALFRQDVEDGHLRVEPLADEHLTRSLLLMERLADHPLRTLDALHLAIVVAVGYDVLATADRIMADAAKALGLKVEGFLPAG
ncbi:MAG: type II toxin-antitoxin system VapC family toxin [Thermoanaerobaculia bacterium]|nr:type II toxin-antitoxin system VapC family toxin [Thermoanaerobaculia bacterium]